MLRCIATTKSLQPWQVLLAALAVLALAAGCSSVERGILRHTTAQIDTLATKVDAIEKGKADNARVEKVEGQVTALSASQAETAKNLAKASEALAEVKKTVDSHGTAIVGLTERMGKAEQWAAAVVTALEKKADKADVQRLGGQVAATRGQLVQIRHITSAGIDETLVLIEGFPLAQYDADKDVLTSGCASLTDAQKKELEAKVVKAFSDHGIKAVRGLASVEKFVDKKSGKSLAESDELNRRCAVSRAEAVAKYLAERLKVDVAYAGLGATGDFGPHAKNRAVVVILTKDTSLAGVAAKPASPAAPPATPAPARPAAPAAPAPAPVK